MTTPATRRPVKYLVKEKSLIGNEIHEAGAVAEYDGLPAENLEPLCDEGRARYQEYLASNAARVERMMAEHPPTGLDEMSALLQRVLAKLAGESQ